MTDFPNGFFFSDVYFDCYFVNSATQKKKGKSDQKSIKNLQINRLSPDFREHTSHSPRT